MPTLRRRGCVALTLVGLLAPAANTRGFDLPAVAGHEFAAFVPAVVGDDHVAIVPPGDTLVDLAYRHRVGFDPLVRLNPNVRVWIPEPGTPVRLPTRAVVPDAPRVGLVVNVPEMRLYDFTGGQTPRLYAIAIGDAQDPSPDGSYRIGEKRVDPHWRVPGSIRAKRPELPAVVAPGPENPLGTRWMTLGASSYGVHGTNTPWSIGRMATHGCIRLYDDEVRELFDRIPSGTPIRVVYQTVKVGLHRDEIFVEAHPDVYGRVVDRREQVADRLGELSLLPHVDLALAYQVVDEGQGVPVPVGRIPSPSPSPIRETNPEVAFRAAPRT